LTLSATGSPDVRPDEPDNGDRSTLLLWLLLPAGWFVAALLSSLPGGRLVGSDGIEVLSWRDMLPDQLVAWGWWALLLPAIGWTVVRIHGLPVRWPGRALLHALAGALFIAAYYYVAERTGEIGIRRSLGAKDASIVLLLARACWSRSSSGSRHGTRWRSALPRRSCCWWRWRPHCCQRAVPRTSIR
jgi:hypothetical protein